MDYDKAKKEILYNTVCNEFVSREQEKVASLVVFMENFTDNNFTKDTLHTFFKSCSCCERGEANIPKLYKMILAQRSLGIPYLPILGGDGKVLCIKLSKLLSIMKDDDFYKEYINNNPPEKIHNNIKIMETKLNKIEAGQKSDYDNEDIYKDLKELQLKLIEEITDNTIKEMEDFEKEKILELEKQANRPDNTKIEKSEEKNTCEDKNIKLQTIENETQLDKEKDNTSSWNCDDMFNNCTNNLRNTWPCSICFGNNN